MTDPFKVQGPALISFSGGRTSAMMLYRIVQACGGTLPDDVRVVFNNTGRELEQTLEFVRDCGKRWGVDIVWLEYATAERPADSWREVTFDTASRDGEPFMAVIKRKGYLPNPVTRFCTLEMKIQTTHRWAKTRGLKKADRIIGLRADEPHRIARIRAREANGGDPWVCRFPLHTVGVTKRDVQDFWNAQNFDLRLPNINGVTPQGNCDLCFLKSAATVQALIAARPSLADWWIKAEATTLASKPSGARFRSDRPSYAAMLDVTQRQQAFAFPATEDIIDCFCGDGA